MTKIYDELEARQKRIQELHTTMFVLENDLQDYYNRRGCVFLMSICFIDKDLIREQKIMLNDIREELVKLQTIVE